ncbi:uncharacterized protein magu isoform X1 [Eurosta solidaginis]|uniref:uncharacterized protein magu isoform X1 n=1 Tax=Eurosta solidaginis TaxID=178769 RepID=UPI0035307EF5
MYISSFIVVCLCAVAELGLTANVPARREQHELTISECAARGGECDETKGRPVCGTDDRTYPSRCHLLRVQCSGHQVSLKYRGPCKACKEARDYALKHKSRNPPKFIPRCKPDGTYAAVQCLGDTGCWCSDITGKPIENTSVRNGKPKCREYTKANIRRSPARHLSPSRGRRTCTSIDRAAFNANLIKVFQSEYIRAGQQKQGGQLTTNGAVGGGSELGYATANDKPVLDWKFTYLDANANQMLDKNEFRELKKLVKRAVKPRRCGRAFGKFCDLDDDDRLTLTEWNNCFSKDEINRHSAAENKNYAVNSISSNNNYHGYTSQQHINRNNNNNNSNRHTISPIFNNHPQQFHLNHHQQNHNHAYNNNNNNNNYNINRNDNLNNINHHASGSLDELDSDSTGDDDESSQHLDYEEDDYDADEGEDGETLSMLNSSTIHYLNPKTEPQFNESESESDCLADQKTALEEQRHGGTLFYVPECTADGRYQRVQCYHSTPYCWCVHEDTGKNIPGTSVKDKRPQCDAIYAAPRPMKGCPEPRKTLFLNDLKEFLKTHIVASASSGGNTTKWHSEDERVATLSFVLLDKNKNKAWERKEWKLFREMVTNTKTLRKCGKKMPRYCDVNSDKKITLTEWLNCLETQRKEMQTSLQSSTEADIYTTSKPKNLTGSNPLEQYLKD